MSKRQRTEEVICTFARCIDDQAEADLEGKLKNNNAIRPQILNMNGFTAQHAAEAILCEYKLMDLVKTLLFLEAGVDGVSRLLDVVPGSEDYCFEKAYFTDFGSDMNRFRVEKTGIGINRQAFGIKVWNEIVSKNFLLTG